jgi:hypothetical protein
MVKRFMNNAGGKTEVESQDLLREIMGTTSNQA